VIQVMKSNPGSPGRQGIIPGVGHRAKAALAARLLPALTPLLALACNAPTQATRPTTQGNLLQNGTFEQGGKPTLSPWRFGNADLAATVPLGAPGKGNWSLRLTADWAPTLGFAYVSVPEARPGDRLELSAFVRAVSPNGGGEIRIAVGPPPGVIGPGAELGRVSTRNTDWTLLKLEVDVPDELVGSVWVFLSSPNTEVISRSGMFDGVELMRRARGS
jgi:hypothetical protein